MVAVLLLLPASPVANSTIPVVAYNLPAFLQTVLSYVNFSLRPFLSQGKSLNLKANSEWEKSWKSAELYFCIFKLTNTEAS